MRFATEQTAYTAGKGNDKGGRAARRKSVFVDQLVNDELSFSPIIPGGSKADLQNPEETVPVDITDEAERNAWRALVDGALPRSVIPDVLREVKFEKRMEIP